MARQGTLALEDAEEAWCSSRFSEIADEVRLGYRIWR